MKNTDGGCFSAINSKANKFYSKGVLVLFCLIYCLVLFRRLGKNLSFNYNPAVQIILMACWAFLTVAVIFIFSKEYYKELIYTYIYIETKHLIYIFMILSLSYMAVEKLTFSSIGFAVIFNKSTVNINMADIKITALNNKFLN